MKKTVSLVLVVILCLSIAACGQTKSDAHSSMRKIVDLAGNEVEIPAAADIKRVVIISPPVMSFVVETIPSTERIVGFNSLAFMNANTQIVEKVFPNW